MNFPRASGILLHPTSLPGRFGIGDLGLRAFTGLSLRHDRNAWARATLEGVAFGVRERLDTLERAEACSEWCCAIAASSAT